MTGGWDPHTEPERFYPYMAEQHVTSDYPPTILVHGTADTDVPYECSAKMAELFGEAGVEHELHTIEVRETFTYEITTFTCNDNGRLSRQAQKKYEESQKKRKEKMTRLLGFLRRMASMVLAARRTPLRSM